MDTLGSAPTFEQLKGELMDGLDEIDGLEELTPSPRVNKAFGRLVSLITAPYTNLASLSSAAALDADLIARKHSVIARCSDSESELEKYWATRIVGDISSAEAEPGGRRWPWSAFTSKAEQETGRAQIALEQFPYLNNYSLLVSLEYHLLLSVGADFSQIIFLGAGPLPLSSLLLARDHLNRRLGAQNSTIINVDQGEEALELGADLTSAVLGVQLDSSQSLSLVPTLSQSHTAISFVHSTASAIPPSALASTKILILAALVGLTPRDKTQLLVGLLKHLPVRAHILLRSADGLRGLVYPQVDEEGLLRACEEAGVRVKVVLVTHPRNEVVNSVVILQRV